MMKMTTDPEHSYIKRKLSESAEVVDASQIIRGQTSEPKLEDGVRSVKAFKHKEDEIQQLVQHINDIKALFRLALKKQSLPASLRKDLTEIVETDLEGDFRVLFLGESGSGKSTLLSALLGRDDYLPSTETNTACTAVPITTQQNRRFSAPFTVEYEYITEDEWREVISSALSILKEPEALDEEHENTRSAVVRLLAVLPQLSESGLKKMSADQVLAHGSSGLPLGRFGFREDKLPLGQQQIKSFKDQPALHEDLVLMTTEPRSTKGSPQLWPLLRSVKLHINEPAHSHTHQSLKHGLSLTDNPGVGDDNHIRNERAMQGLLDYDLIVLTKYISRANSNSIGKDLERAVLREIAYTNRLQRLVIVVTQSDNVDLSKMTRDLDDGFANDLRKRLIEIRQKIPASREEQQKLIGKLDQMQKIVNDCVPLMKNYKRKRTIAAKNDKKYKPPPSVLNSIYLGVDDTRTYDADEFADALQRLQTLSVEFKHEHDKLSSEVSQYERQIQQHLTDERTLASEYNKRTISVRADFIKQSQIRGHDKILQQHHAETRASDEHLMPKLEDCDAERSSSGLTVFVTSAKAYQQHHGVREPDDAKEIIKSLEDTEIPMLTRYLASNAADARLENLQKICNKVAIAKAALKDAVRSHDDREILDLGDVVAAVQDFQQEMKKIPEHLDNIVIASNSDVAKSFDTEIAQPLQELQGRLAARGVRRLAQYSKPVVRGNRSHDALYIQEFRAGARKFGRHTGQNKSFDWNSDLALVVKTRLEKALKAFFVSSTGSSRKGSGAQPILDELSAQITGIVQGCYIKFSTLTQGKSILNDSMQRLFTQTERHKKELESHVSDAKKAMGDVYVEASKGLQHDMRLAMSPAYERAADEAGTGALNRMAQDLAQGLEVDAVMEIVTSSLVARIVAEIGKVFAELQRGSKRVADSMITTYELSTRIDEIFGNHTQSAEVNEDETVDEKLRLKIEDDNA